MIGSKAPGLGVFHIPLEKVVKIYLLMGKDGSVESKACKCEIFSKQPSSTWLRTHVVDLGTSYNNMTHKKIPCNIDFYRV